MRREQLGNAEAAINAIESGTREPGPEDSKEVLDAKHHFLRAVSAIPGELAIEKSLTQQQFIQMLLSPSNNAVAPAEQDLSAPLAHYWGACSHNSYIVGDQLTGLSSADEYRRQLIQGCRHLEIDCWDGKKVPSVTHGYTFVPFEEFKAVAKAIEECAFVTSELPVILSLEMHCSPPQQHQIAELLIQHLGGMLMSYDEFCSIESPKSLPISALKRRVLVKGKCKHIVDGSPVKTSPLLFKMMQAARRSKAVDSERRTTEQRTTERRTTEQRRTSTHHSSEERRTSSRSFRAGTAQESASGGRSGEEQMAPPGQLRRSGWRSDTSINLDGLLVPVDPINAKNVRSKVRRTDRLLASALALRTEDVKGFTGQRSRYRQLDGIPTRSQLVPL